MKFIDYNILPLVPISKSDKTFVNSKMEPCLKNDKGFFNYGRWLFFVFILFFSASNPIYGYGNSLHMMTMMVSGGNVSYGRLGSNSMGSTSSYSYSVYKEGENIRLWFPPSTIARLSYVTINGKNVTSSINGNEYIIENISSDIVVKVVYADENTGSIPSNIYMMTMMVSGGNVSYGRLGSNSMGSVSSYSYSVYKEGESIRLWFPQKDMNRLEYAKINETDITSSLNGNEYIIDNISSDITIKVKYKTYTLSITSIGNGSVSYNSSVATIRNKTVSYIVNSGASASVTFAPDNGYRTKSVKVNNTDVTSSISNNSYTISNISSDTSIEVEFEAIPPTTYTLSIKVTGNGSTSYSGTTIRGKTTTFTVNEGTNVTITFSPDNGYRIKSVKVNNVDVTSSVSNNSYTISNIGRNTTVEVEFEAIPTTTYSLSIKATGNGSASYNGTIVRNKTSTFTVNEGTNARITFTPDNGYRIKSLMVNSADVTSYISSNAYTINNITKNTTLVVEFEAETTAFTISGVNYAITSSNEKSVSVSKGIYGDVLEIPATVTYQNTNWKVTGIESDALANSSDLCAIIWNPEAAFTESISNPNLLLYVKAASYAPNTIKNVIVNGTANSITLTDAESGNNFYCPQEFTAKSVSYTHHYKMETGMGEAKGWETIALPFDVQKVKHQSKDEIVMFANWNSGDSKKPFWLMQYGNSGWTDANSIKAYTPYIISMPNHTKYKEDYKLNGNVTFSAENVKIGKTENMSTSYSNGKTFIPNFALQTDKSYYALNVNNDYIIYNGNIPKGSLFYPGLRDIHPFEAYMTTASGARSIAIADDMMTTGIHDIMEMLDEQKGVRVYNLKGQLIKTEDGKSLDQVKKTLPAGVYIVNGQKMIIK